MRLPKRPSPTTLFVVAGLLLALFVGFTLSHRRRTERIQAEQEARMRLPDTLRVVTLSGATTFFVYRDEPMGYQYELLRLFAEKVRRPLKLYVVHDMTEAKRLILSGEMNLCITPYAVTQSSRSELRFTGPEELSGLTLVQRRLINKEDTARYVRDVTGLLGKTITLLSGSREEKRVERLEQQLGGKIYLRLITADTLDSEDLIDQVASGSIDYTIADQELARLAKTYYPSIDISVEVGFQQSLRWFTSPDHEGLALALDKWAEDIPSQPSFKNIYRKYFELNKSEEDEVKPTPSPRPVQSGHSPTIGRGERTYIHEGGLSPFDAIFKKEAQRINWPWQLLAAIAYQESNFKPHVVGWSGARGLMGIMPRTGRIFGASKDELLDPNVSVRVAVDCIRATEKLFTSIPDLEDRIAVTLAAYNAGPAHLQDAIRLAAKYGYSTTKWAGGIEEALRLKSEAKYYNDPVCRAGYLRGKGVTRYVDQVLSRYHGYLAHTQ